MTVTYKNLLQDVAGEAVAIRAIIQLQPAGGAGEKVFPPSYILEGDAKHKYAVETRIDPVTKQETETVLLDSVASQANRAELGLLQAWRNAEISFPLARIDFTAAREIARVDELTALEVPHRIADAIFRDSELNGEAFRMSNAGKAIFNATPHDCYALYQECPTALIFGQWDSTGQAGGQGSKFQRIYYSEIVGHDTQVGKKTESRLDPLSIENPDVADRQPYESADPAQKWTFDPEEAKKTRGKPASLKPADINHSNIPPKIDEKAGGVTISKAIQTVVISYAGLRKLRFSGFTMEQETAARATLAALSLAALAYSIESGYDLRSRCLLIPEAAPQAETLGRNGGALRVEEIDSQNAAQTLKESISTAKQLGIDWNADGLQLTPSEKLIELIRRSREKSDESSN